MNHSLYFRTRKQTSNLYLPINIVLKFTNPGHLVGVRAFINVILENVRTAKSKLFGVQMKISL